MEVKGGARSVSVVGWPPSCVVTAVSLVLLCDTLKCFMVQKVHPPGSVE